MVVVLSHIIAFAVGMIVGVLIREFLWRLALNACVEIDEPFGREDEGD